MNVVNCLKEKHNLIEIDTSFLENLAMMYSKLLLSNEMNLEALGNEEFLSDYQNIRLGMNIPNLFRPLVVHILKMIGQRRSAVYAKYMGNKDTGKIRLKHLIKKLNQMT